MRYLPFILIILLAGCATNRRCFKKFPPEVRIDTVERQGLTEYLPTTIEVKIPGDTVYVESPEAEIIFTGDTGSITVEHHISPIEARTELAYSKAWVVSNKLSMLLIQHDSIMLFKIDSAIQITRDKETITIVEVHEKEVIPKWATTFRSLFWFAVGLIVFILVLMLVFIKIK